MGIHAFLAGANAVCFLKNKRKYAMICAWATMIDYDVVGLLIGERSVTGKNLEVGMMIGVSALSKEQKDIAITLGNNHSDEVDKFANVPHEIDESAILIKNAKNNLVCKIKSILHLNSENEDLFVVAKFVRTKENKAKDFLEAEEVFR
ncbi:MAG TPA: flavin reductase [Bacilli bacterium]|nr:flavin reductase [Bacilli bacterium]